MVLGNAIAIRGHPLRVAEEIAMLDHLTNGRTGLRVRSRHRLGALRAQRQPGRSRSRFNEAHDLIKKAWTSGGPFEWIGPSTTSTAM